MIEYDDFPSRGYKVKIIWLNGSGELRTDIVTYLSVTRQYCHFIMGGKKISIQTRRVFQISRPAQAELGTSE